MELSVRGPEFDRVLMPLTISALESVADRTLRNYILGVFGSFQMSAGALCVS